MDRVRRADAVTKAYELHLGEVADRHLEEATAFLSGVNPQEKVNSKHHVVPKFVLERWADDADQVQVYSRVDRKISCRNIKDLGYSGFYTVINQHGQKDSTVESLLAEVEGAAATAYADLLNPFVNAQERQRHLGTLAQFAAFQQARTPRRRREIELQGEWYAKTFAQGQVSDEELRLITIRPHQNEAIKVMAQLAPKLFPIFACRPLALIRLRGPLLYIGDEPVVVNAPYDPQHLEDCFLTDEQIAARMLRRRRKDRKTRRPRELRGRMVHLHSGVGSGIGVATEIVLPISPRAALVWGPLLDGPYIGPIEEVVLSAEETAVFAERLNAATCENALDWIITRPNDDTLKEREIPPVGPLLQICDGENAAAHAVNTLPKQIRPGRLWVPNEPAS